MDSSTAVLDALMHKVLEDHPIKELIVIDQEDESKGIKVNDLSHLLATSIPLTSIHNSDEQYSSRRERRKAERNNKKTK